ncbi:MAG TPA: DUF2203 domain-containing protein [Gaiellaceae bacterium]|nr:DUF2203 domain-containing protein [Gaiellaceae bacterium]
MAEHHFTVAEANALLPTVRPLVQRLVDERSRLGEALEKRSGLAELTGSNGGGFHPRLPADVDSEVEAAAEGIKECVEQLTGLGVQVKDIDAGLIDFPSTRDGAEVLLCWQLGEDAVEWWHTPGGGYAGRRPL